MERCYILFGSNMGDRERLFADACLLINNRCGRVMEVSTAYESEPWGFVADEWFLNRVIAVDTELDPEELLQKLLDIEAELGRVRHPEQEGYTSRPIDLDILYFGKRVIQTESLTVPHPRLHLRRFALVPLCELIPDFVHPVLNKTQRELLQECPDTSEVKERFI
jgi:2-amino-4-hydroxy-6-hydroxymethyldihydropteridine diphosphokinase